MGIVEFIRFCLDDDEIVAEACIDAGKDYEILLPDGVVPIAAHVAQHDPIRVLAEVKGKRFILDNHGPECEAGDVCPTMRGLAAAWWDRRGYDPNWKLP